MQTDPQVRQSLRYSFIEGIFTTCMSAFTAEYFAPFLLLLGGSTRAVGLLSALPNVVASLAQVKSADVSERMGSRKRLITHFVLLQAITLLVLSVLVFTQRAGIFSTILLVTLFTAFGFFPSGAWGSLMSDLVEENKRGAYFGWRARMLGFVSLVAMGAAGLFIQQAQKHNAYLGFGVLFTCAFALRMVSWHFLGRMHDPPFSKKEESPFGLIEFILHVRQSNFTRFSLFVALLLFAANVSGPFFVVYMIRDLHFSYMLYTALIAVSVLTGFLSIQRWGALADRVGNVRVMQWTAGIISILPALWLIGPYPLWIAAVQLMGGFVWAGFNISTFNFVFDVCSPPKRTRGMAYFSALNMLFVCMGALAGGFLAPKLPALLGHKLLTLFLISSLLRLLVVYIIPLKFREVRTVQPIRNAELFFSMIAVKPLLEWEKRSSRV